MDTTSEPEEEKGYESLDDAESSSIVEPPSRSNIGSGGSMVASSTTGSTSTQSLSYCGSMAAPSTSASKAAPLATGSTSTPSTNESMEAPSSSCHESEPGSAPQMPPSEKKYIGPFCDAAGITTDIFGSDQDLSLPTFDVLKNGLVLELHRYLTKQLSFSPMRFVGVLIRITGSEVEPKNAQKYVKRLVEKNTKLKRIRKAAKTDDQLKLMSEEIFQMDRKRKLKYPDTPRKKKLRQELSRQKADTKKVSKKLQTERATLESEKICLQKQLEKEKAEHQSTQSETVALNNSIQTMIQERDSLQEKLSEVNATYDPMKHDMESYKKLYKDAQSKLDKVEQKLIDAQQQMKKFSIRNINRQKKRHADTTSKLRRTTKEMDKTISSLTEELEDTGAKLKESQVKLDDLRKDLQWSKSAKDTTRLQRNYLQKKVTRLNANRTDTVEVDELEERVGFLQQKNGELENLVELLQEENISTMTDSGQYSDEVRETTMALLAMNVSMSKTSEVIRVVLKKMARKTVDRLPSKATNSRFIVEARHLADLEVAEAMRVNRPDDALGNCIHGDGTTKYHKKYQNFQVTLADGTTRTLGLTQMASGDTTSVVQAFKDRIHELAHAVSTSSKESSEQVYKELMATVKSTMTDQGATMPQFSEQLECMRNDLLPEVVQNWENLPDDVKKCTQEFGRFYCKMHPLINFVEEIGKTLKSFEDITASGKNAHTLLTSECGVVRLVRTASKAYHHRGSDKSGVEDAFTAYVNNEYNVPNLLVNYIGNRANILFEGAAVTYFHRHHLINFVTMLPQPNALLLSVAEDAAEKVHQAELRALGIVYKVITDPLWLAVKTADNVLSMNSVLHELQKALEVWKEDASGLLQGETAISKFPAKKDEIYDCLFEECKDAELQALCIQALELICCAILLILQRQCKDQLPGGKYWQPSNDTQEKYANVPSTNMVGERDFSYLDLMVREKPSARTISLEALIMWSNNKTLNWLDTLDDATRAMYMAEARAHAKPIINRYRARMKDIMAKRWENLQTKQLQRQAKETKIMQTKVKCTEEVTKQGGLWTTAERVKEETKKLHDQNASDEDIRRAMYSQLNFHQKILASKTPRRECLQLGTTDGGKRRDFTGNEMKNHLIEDPEELSAQNEASATRTSQIEYFPEEERDTSFLSQKNKLIKKIEEERVKRAVMNSKKYLDRLLHEPKLLVGKTVEHKLCETAADTPQWYTGTISAITKTTKDPAKTVFSIKYRNEDVEWEFPLLMDLKKNELILLEAL